MLIMSYNDEINDINELYVLYNDQVMKRVLESVHSIGTWPGPTG